MRKPQRHEHHGAGVRVVHILRWFDGRPACGAAVEAGVRRPVRLEQAVKTHELKTWPGVFEVMWLGRKAFELRRNDRDFAEGDVLRLREWSEEDDYTGREILAKVSFVLQNVPEWGLKPGFCIMALHDLRKVPR